MNHWRRFLAMYDEPHLCRPVWAELVEPGTVVVHLAACKGMRVHEVRSAQATLVSLCSAGDAADRRFYRVTLRGPWPAVEAGASIALALDAEHPRGARYTVSVEATLRTPRLAPGETPTVRLNARLKAASDP